MFRGVVVYYGNSEHFKPIEKGELIPVYECSFFKNEDEKLEISFSEIEY